MTVCPRCGTENPAQAQACSLCGLAFTNPPLGSAAPPAGARREFAKTLMGQGPMDLSALGVKPVAPPAREPEAARPPASKFNATMMGVAPPPLPPEHAAPALGNSQQPVLESGQAGRANLNATIPFAPPSPDPKLGVTQPLPKPPPAALNPANKTIMGIARPGIAPLNPGVAKPVAPSAPAPTDSFPAPPPAPLPALPTLSPVNSLEPRDARRTPWLAAVALGGALVLLATAAAAYFLLKGPGPIEARALLDSEGREQLELRCGGCKDGDQIRLNQTVAPFRGGKALLPVPGGLKIGETRFEFALLRSGARKESRVSLSVPLEYRVRADESGLSDAEPHLSVRVEALAGTTVSIDGHPVSLVGGKGSYDIPVTNELSGVDASVRKLDRRVAYRISPPGSSGESGEVAFQIGITPLSIQAPGESIVIEGSTFMLAGRTAKGATLTVSGRAIPVEPDGRFTQNLSISAVGESNVVVRASAADHAPRLASFRVRRVQSLKDEARSLRPSATQSYATIVADIERAKGSAVALDGTVSEVGGDDFSTLLLLDTQSGCRAAPCLTRVIHGARLSLKAGDRVSVFGKVRGAVDGPRGAKLPEVFADFVVKGPK
ncbi:MAG TPA: hypothetical protein VFQ35_23055 [Polyangiaceae bacterium]|nr:hypothetical protein [Polyangiaceae bacterium]